MEGIDNVERGVGLDLRISYEDHHLKEKVEKIIPTSNV